MLRKLIVLLVNTILVIVSRREINGLENVEQSIAGSPVLVTTNHIGYMDSLLILSVPLIVNHPDLIVVIAEKYQKYAILRWVVKNLNFMFIDRFNADLSTLRKLVSRLNQNGLMILAPEGTRSPQAALLEGKPGAAYLASKTQALIIPIGIVGTEDEVMRKRLPRLRRLDINVQIGEPYRIPNLPKKDRGKFLEAYTDEIMCQIAALLPSPYRGVYSEHPRVSELTAG